MNRDAKVRRRARRRCEFQRLCEVGSLLTAARRRNKNPAEIRQLESLYAAALAAVRACR